MFRPRLTVCQSTRLGVSSIQRAKVEQPDISFSVKCLHNKKKYSLRNEYTNNYTVNKGVTFHKRCDSKAATSSGVNM